jgi:hypothetical protein
MTSKLFTSAGLSKHVYENIVVEKVRYGTDIVRVTKMLNSQKKIWHKPTGSCLSPVRVDMVELPNPMTKIEACNYMLTLPEFQSPADQALIHDAIYSRTPKAPRVKKEKSSIDTLKQRRKNVTELDILAAIN